LAAAVTKSTAVVKAGLPACGGQLRGDQNDSRYSDDGDGDDCGDQEGTARHSGSQVLKR